MQGSTWGSAVERVNNMRFLIPLRRPDAERFPNNRAFRGWHGLVPRSNQSGECESKGLSISQAGPDPIKKYGFLGAETARQWDPQIAAIYHDQT
jgi:hypothetical protein